MGNPTPGAGPANPTQQNLEPPHSFPVSLKFGAVEATGRAFYDRADGGVKLTLAFVLPATFEAGSYQLGLKYCNGKASPGGKPALVQALEVAGDSTSPAGGGAGGGGGGPPTPAGGAGGAPGA